MQVELLIKELDETLQTRFSDGGLCTGTAKDAIFMFLGEQQCK